MVVVARRTRLNSESAEVGWQYFRCAQALEQAQVFLTYISAVLLLFPPENI